MTRRPTAKLIILVSLVLLAGTEFIIRGPLRVKAAGDFASTYVSALHFVHGENPYSSKDFLSRWHAAGAPQKYSLDDFIQHPIYPPTTLVVFAPLAKLSWPWAVRCYTWFCTVGYLVLVWLLARLIADSWRSLRRLGFVAFALALSPIQTAITQGNVSAMALVLCGFALYLAYLRDELISGVLVALAFCAKPTSAMAALAVLLLCRREKSITAFMCTCCLIVAIAALAMFHIDPAWRVDYQSNLHVLFGPNGAADFASDSTGHFDLVNLQVPLYQMFPSIRLANLLAFTISGILFLVWLLLFRKDSDTKAGSYWIGAGSLSLIALLPVYQRNYNAGVIVFAAVWAFDKIPSSYARAAMVASLAFLVPGEAYLRNMGLDQRLLSTPPWGLLMMSQLTWSTLFVIIICCLYKAMNPTLREEPYHNLE